MEKITINGKEFELREIDFNAVCELEDLGMSIIDIKDKTFLFKSIRALVAFVERCDLEKAGKEVEAHLTNKGKINDFTPLFEMVSKSDFFRNLSQQ